MQAREEKVTISTVFVTNYSNFGKPKQHLLLLHAEAPDSNMGKEGEGEQLPLRTTCRGWTLCYVLEAAGSSSSSNSSSNSLLHFHSIKPVGIIGDQRYLLLRPDRGLPSIYRD